MYKLGKRSLKNMIGIHPELAFAVHEAIKITKQDFGILNLGGLRTNAEQARLYAQGRTTEGKKVTWTLDSYHQRGLAVDLVAYSNGKFNWKVKNYPLIVEAMKTVIQMHGLEIDHGYDLWGKDLPHWQMTGMKPYYDVRKLK